MTIFITPPPRVRRFVWKLPLSAKDEADLRMINQRLQRLRYEESVLKRLRAAIIGRGRMAQRIKDGWKPSEAAKVPRPDSTQSSLL